MLTLYPDRCIHAMSRSSSPAARAASGDTVCFHTLDCFSGQLTREDQLLGGLDWDTINPATGPLYVEGAEAGDVLKVEILSIETASQGVMVDGPGEGAVGPQLAEERTKVLQIQDGVVRFSDRLSFPIRPMIGVIGVAPAAEDIPTNTPGAHGGNMDCTRIGAGATLYLPVNVPGALLAMGDLHAIMGDGEVGVCGVEVAGVVTVRVTALKACALPTPFLVMDDAFMTICSAETADEAGDSAILAMHTFLTGELGMDPHEANMLMSVCGDLRVCQVVDPEKTFRLEMPIRVAQAHGYTFR
ncbi:MAG: acetamidase/formamidase family protein [Clostridia bacterium]|nr:acetamidase/formamidase family protein [Clostridia bacterium]